MPRATVTVQGKIDISPDGIKITFEGIDSDLSRLLEQADRFSVESREYHAFDSETVTILSDQAISFVDKEIPTEE